MFLVWWVYGWLLICLLLVVDLLTVACDAVSTGSDLRVICWVVGFDGFVGWFWVDVRFEQLSLVLSWICCCVLVVYWLVTLLIVLFIVVY